MKKIKKENQTDYGQILAGWEFDEHSQHQRSRAWHITVGIVFLLALIYSIMTANFLFVIILILAAVIVFLRGRESPAKIGLKIYEDGIEIGLKFYDWDRIKNFRLVYQPPEVKRLYFDIRGMITDISVPLENQNPLKIREILKKYLAEDLTKTEETIVDRLNRWLKI